MEGGAANAVEEVFWWLGWHRLYVAAAGVLAGLTLGYLTGSLGTTALAVGALLAVAGFVSKRILFLEIVFLVGSAAVMYTVGGSELLGLADMREPARGVAGALLDVAGVGYTDPLSAVGEVVLGVAIWSLTGLGVGLVVWGMGAIVVNRTYRNAYGAFSDLVEEKGEALLGEGTYTTVKGTGSVLGLKPMKEYHASNILVRPNSIELNYGSMLSMPRKAVSVKGSTKHMYYDQLASVDYEDPYFEIRMADGEVVKVVTSEKPEGLLREIEDRLKTYKRSPEKAREEARREREESGIGAGVGAGTGPEPDTSEAEADEASDDAVGQESKERAQEAVDDIEDVVESALDEMGDPLEMMEGDEVEPEESQVEVELEGEKGRGKEA